MEFNANTRPLHQAIESIRATNPAAIQDRWSDWLLCALAERDAAAAREALSALGDRKIGLGDKFNFTRAFVEGLIARMTNDEQKARSAFTAARAEQEKIVQAQPDFGPAWCVLGMIDAAWAGKRKRCAKDGARLSCFRWKKMHFLALSGQILCDHRSLGWRKGSRLRTAGQASSAHRVISLWLSKTEALVGPAARLPVLRKNRRLSGAEIIL